MSLIEKKIIDKIEVLENGLIQIREATIIEKEGKELARNFNRYVLTPGDDLTAEDIKVVSIANAIWTPEVITSYQTQLSESIKNISSVSASLSGSQP